MAEVRGGEPVIETPLFNMVRATDPVTSVMAAEKVAPRVAGDRLIALGVFYLMRDRDPIDDFQLADYTSRKQTSMGKRRKEMEEVGFVERCGRRASPSRLTNSVVYSYRITLAGRLFYLAQTEKK